MRQLNLAMLAVAALVVMVVSATWLQAERSSAVQVDQSAAPHYSIVSTDAAHLIITDNRTDTLHFYTVGKEGEPGDDLQLRGSIDLSRVGARTIKVAKHKEQ